MISNFDSFYRLAESTPPSQVSDYLYRLGWILEDSREGTWERWLQPRSGEPDTPWMLPLLRTFADCDRRVSQILHAVAVEEFIDASELGQRMNIFWADQIFLSASFSDSIVVRTTSALPRLYETLHRIIELAAVFTENPETSFKGGRRSNNIRRFMETAVVIEASSSSSLKVAARVQLPQVREPGGSPRSFERQAFENLFLAVKWSKGELPLDVEVEPAIGRLGVQVLKALERVPSRARPESSTIAFEWSPSLPPSPGVSADVFSFSRAELIDSMEVLEPRSALHSLPLDTAAEKIPTVERVNLSERISGIFLGDLPDGSPELWLTFPWRDDEGRRTLKAQLSVECYLEVSAVKISSEKVSVVGVARRIESGEWSLEGSLGLPDGRTVSTVESRRGIPS